jgi:hypothetical protein
MKKIEGHYRGNTIDKHIVTYFLDLQVSCEIFNP